MLSFKEVVKRIGKCACFLLDSLVYFLALHMINLFKRKMEKTKKENK